MPVGEVDDGGSGGAPVKFPSSLGALGGAVRGKRERRGRDFIGVLDGVDLSLKSAN